VTVTIYGDLRSGNCYKIHLLAGLLGLEHRWVAVDILAGETRREAFLAKNRNGKLPLLELEDGRCLAESNAILNYLGEASPLIPGDRFLRAEMLAWQFFEQYSHEPYIAVARFINKFLGLPETRRAEFDSKQEGGHRALAVMEHRLARASWLVGEAPTLADISLYAYTHVAHEGGFVLDPYPGILAWLGRIEALPGFSPMPE
jgi:glutathione S-transferase